MKKTIKIDKGLAKLIKRDNAERRICAMTAWKLLADLFEVELTITEDEDTIAAPFGLETHDGMGWLVAKKDGPPITASKPLTELSEALYFLAKANTLSDTASKVINVLYNWDNTYSWDLDAETRELNLKERESNMPGLKGVLESLRDDLKSMAN